MKFKRIVSCLMGAAMAVSLAVPAFAYDLKSFRDVAEDNWAHDAIMEMVDMGLFVGTSDPDANGVATFSPTNPMTRAQFVTVVTRYLYNDELKELEAEGKPSPWYHNNYDLAVEHGIISEKEFAENEMSVSMTRQEMAMVLVRAAEQLGQYPEQLISTLRIADYNNVGTYYQDYVRECYSMGMICGVDNKGTFNPHGTLNRAEAATVLYRLISPESRQKVDFSTPNISDSSVMTIYEGQATSRPARAGDIYVKADGTKVTLKIGPNGILGEGQGVAPDKNLTGPSMQWTNDGGLYRFNFNVDVHGSLTDSLGVTLQNQDYCVNMTTGEGHWSNEWLALGKIYKVPKENGTYYGQVSTDPYKLYVWDDIVGWVINYS